MFFKKHKKTNTYVALFNYGGGIRGIVPAYVMAEIETRTGLRMADMVDIFTGPSTGSILNAAMTRRHKNNPYKPMYRARHMVSFYERDGAKIFPPDKSRAFRGILHDFNNRTLRLSQMNELLRHGHYDPSYLHRSLHALLGDVKLSESLRTLIIPTYNIDGGQIVAPDNTGGDQGLVGPMRGKNNFVDGGGHAIWLKNVVHADHPTGVKSKTPDVSMLDAVMASCAAPTFFPCHHMTIKYPDARGAESCTAIDGCIFDNPCISYLGAIRRHIPEDAKLIMIVLGTGYTNQSVRGEDWNSYGALGIVDPVNDLPLINIFFHASESALMEGFAEEMGENLYVFNKSLLPDENHPNMPSKQIDDATPENIEKLKRFAQDMIDENSHKFDTLCDFLVANADA